MDKNIDLLFLRVTSRIEIPAKLKLGDDIEFVMKGGVCKEEVGDNNDGSVTILYKVKPISIEIK